MILYANINNEINKKWEQSGSTKKLFPVVPDFLMIEEYIEKKGAFIGIAIINEKNAFDWYCISIMDRDSQFITYIFTVEE